jgi:GT2 family glycosyltransferase
MISIIIIVKNDKRVRHTIEKLKLIKQPEGGSEIIVVDSSTQPSVVKKDFPDVRWFKYKPKLKKVTIPEQRNVGIAKSRGEIIAFIDADCTPDKNWLVRLVKPIQDRKEYITAGSCVARPKSYMKLDEMTKDPYMNECPSMNMAVSKEVFNKVGLFDESFDRVSDSELCIRARKAGYKIRAVPNSIIFHDWGGFKMNIKRGYGSGVGRMRLYRIHPDQLSLSNIYRNRKNAYSLIYMTYILFMPVCIVFPFYLLLPFAPSIIRWRNPLKEFVNIAYGAGMIREAVKPKRYVDV